MMLLRTLDWLAEKSGTLSAICALIMAGLGTLDVVAMSVFNSPITGTIEFSSMLLVSCLFLAMPMAAKDDDNISVDLLINAVPASFRRLLSAFNNICTIGFFSILTFLSWKLALKGWDKGDVMTGAINFQLWPFKMLAAVGATLALMTLCARLIREVSPKSRKQHTPSAES